MAEQVQLPPTQMIWLLVEVLRPSWASRLGLTVISFQSKETVMKSGRTVLCRHLASLSLHAAEILAEEAIRVTMISLPWEGSILKPAFSSS